MTTTYTTDVHDAVRLAAQLAGDACGLADARIARTDETFTGSRFLAHTYLVDAVKRATENHTYGVWGTLIEDERFELLALYADAYADAWLEAFYVD